MRRERRRLLDLSMRVTVHNPLTASSCWGMAAVLTESRHDAHGVSRGDFDAELTSQTEATVCRCSSRLVGTDKDTCDGYVARSSR